MKQEEKEKQITDAVIGKQLKSIDYYLLNRPNYFFPNQPEQLVDTAVEFNFNDGTSFSFGMNFNYVAIDAFDHHFEKTIRDYHEQIPVIKTNVNEDEQWKNYIGKTISTVHITYNWFEDIEEEKHFIPQDIEFYFTDGSYLIVCATGYNIDDEGVSIGEPDSEGEVLVLFNEEDAKFFKRGKYYTSDENSDLN